ncbi:MAG: PPOX class F420-dependent oxidoreductase [Actinobacteria bacterium]|nr:PPOX class F420-dependent oxidoreductase [Actinomycetota bacterium]
MSQDALRQLIENHSRGVLATLKSDGRPQLSNVGYARGDDGRLLISTTNKTAKTANLRRDGRASLHVASDDFWSYAVVEGTTDLSPVAQSPDDETVEALVDYFRRIQGEHPDWDEYRQAMVEEGRLVVRLSVDHIYGRA